MVAGPQQLAAAQRVLVDAAAMCWDHRPVIASHQLTIATTLMKGTSVFFDDYPRFLDTSETASGKRRLNLRQEAMIAEHADLLRGKRVLDIASHDGRWSFAALKTAGASHVIGVEANSELVKNGEETFEHYGVDKDQYRFIDADVFDVLADPAAHDIEVDVVMCLGFMYHTLRYAELLNGVRALEPELMLLDTAVHPAPGKLVRIFDEDTSKESASADGVHGHRGHMITGRPTVDALQMMLEVHGYKIEEKFDWPAYLLEHDYRPGPVAQYNNGKRITWVCRVV